MLIHETRRYPNCRHDEQNRQTGRLVAVGLNKPDESAESSHIIMSSRSADDCVQVSAGCATVSIKARTESRASTAVG